MTSRFLANRGKNGKSGSQTCVVLETLIYTVKIGITLDLDVLLQYWGSI